MPIGMLRLINPPGHRRRRPFPRYTRTNLGDDLRIGASLRAGRKLAKKKASTKASRNPGGKTMKKKRKMPPRYKSGPKKGKFMSKRAVAASRRRHVKANPKRVKRTRRNYLKTGRSGATLGSEKELARLMERRQKLARAAAAKGMSLAEYEAYLKKARAKKYRKARKAKKTKKIGGTVARKRKTKKVKRSKASYKKAARKAARTRAAKKLARSAAARKAAKSKKRKTRRNAAPAATNPRRRRRRRVRRNVGRKAIQLTRKRPSRRIKVGQGRGRKARVYKVTRRGRKGRAYARLKRVRRNPNFKGMLIQGGMLYAGVLGMRVLGNLLDKYVVQKYIAKPGQTGMTAQLVSIAPAAIGFGLAAFADKVIKGKPALVTGIQMGATIALFDAIVQKFVKPALATSAPSVAALLGVDGLGFQGYHGYQGYHEYIPAPAQPLGVDVHEAMALDEYVQTPAGMGYDVSEALADTEVDSFQRGYASGSLAKTAFSV